MDHDLDAVVCGVGSGGTLTGIGRFMKRVAPHVEMVLADPEGSILADLVETGELKNAGSWLVEGVGEDFVPANCDLGLVSQAFTIGDGESFRTARELLSNEGILAGSSSGMLIAAALRYCRAQRETKRVVTLICDSGNKYLSKMFNDYWMIDQGFIERENVGDLRDLIGRRTEDTAVVSVVVEDTLLVAHGCMRLYDVSQLPVMDDGRIVGILDESDLLLVVYQHEERFGAPVREFMTSRLEIVEPDQPLDTLIPIFRADRVAIVVETGEFLGLITQIDLINHLRRGMK